MGNFATGQRNAQFDGLWKMNDLCFCNIEMLLELKLKGGEK